LVLFCFSLGLCRFEGEVVVWVIIAWVEGKGKEEGEQRMADCGWGMEDGGWGMRDGGWKVDRCASEKP
jgi:hypothetical protein